MLWTLFKYAALLAIWRSIAIFLELCHARAVSATKKDPAAGVRGRRGVARC